MQTETVDAEFTPMMNGSYEPGQDVDAQTGEVLEPRISSAMVQHQEQRAQLAIGAVQAIQMAQKEKSLMEARMSIARERPREWMMVRDRLMKECDRPGFADAAIYSKPVGGQKIEGMSIRFAEACIRGAGNLRVTTELVEDGQKAVTYRVSVMDLESGSSFDEEFTLAKTVERSTVKDGHVVLSERTNSRGKKTYLVMATEDELMNKKGAAASKLIRNGVLRLMPGDIVDECRNRCEKTIANRDAKNPTQSRNALLDAMSALGITPKQVAEYLGKDNAELITIAEVTRMRPIYAALKEGETTWRDVLDSKPGGAKKPGQQAPQVPQPPATPATPPPPAAAAPVQAEAPKPPPEEVSADPIEVEKQKLRALLAEAKSHADLKPILDRVRTLPAADKAELEAEYKAAWKKVGG